MILKNKSNVLCGELDELLNFYTVYCGISLIDLKLSNTVTF